MSLSPRARAAARKLKTFSADDVQSISEMIKHEVQHATDLVAERARQTEARVRELTGHASEDLGRFRKTTVRNIREHPVQSGLMVLIVGLIVGVLLARRR